MSFVHSTLQQVSHLATSEIAQESAKFVIRRAQKKVFAKITSKLVGSQLKKLGKQLAKKMTAKIAANMGKRVAIMFGKIASKCSSIITAPLAVLDVVSMILDASDSEGYNNFTSNKIIQDALKTVEYEGQQSAKLSGSDWPGMFPLETCYPKEWQEYVVPMLESEFADKMFEMVPDSILDLIVDMEAEYELEKTVAEEQNLPVPKQPEYPDKVFDAFSTAFADAINSDPEKRDLLIFECLTKKAKTVDLTHIAIYPQMSTKTRSGVSLSESGVTWWNKTHLQDWFKYNDLFRPDDTPDPPKDWVEPPVATFVDTYREVDTNNPGTSDRPNMVSKPVPKGTLGNNWRRVPINLKKKTPLYGKQITNSKLKQKLSSGRTSFTPKEREEFNLQSTLSDTDYIMVGDKAFSPTHRVSLCFMGGHIPSYCMKERNAKSLVEMVSGVDTSKNVNPMSYKVFFDDGTFNEFKTAVAEAPQDPIKNPVQCTYTDKFCTRLGLKHKYNFYENTSDCWSDGGQQVSEMLFGATVTRGIYRGFHDMLGFQCNPACSAQEYCENRKCHPKKPNGSDVGASARWKCLSGKECFGKCHDGPGTIPEGVDVGWEIAGNCKKYCKYTNKVHENKCSQCWGNDKGNTCPGRELTPYGDKTGTKVVAKKRSDGTTNYFCDAGSCQLKRKNGEKCWHGNGKFCESGECGDTQLGGQGKCVSCKGNKLENATPKKLQPLIKKETKKYVMLKKTTVFAIETIVS